MSSRSPKNGGVSTAEAVDTPPTDDPRALVQFYLIDHHTYPGKAIDIALLALNLLFVAAFVAETYVRSPLLRRLEIGIAAVFAVEYLRRLYGAPNRIAEATNPYTITDLAAIAPTVLSVVAPTVGVANVGFLRSLRVVRVLRFYRFTRDAEFFFGTISDNALRAIKLLLTVLVLFFVASGLFYSAEQAANPDVNSFGDAFYYMIVTLSTVGFGDILPVTAAGRWVTVGSILAAIILVPWQASRVIRAWQADETVDVTCPDCGLTGHDPDASHCKACGAVIYQEYDGPE